MATIDINAVVAAQSPTENASKKWVVYTSDTGETFGVKMNENIAEALGFDDFAGASIEKEKPASLKMRTISFADATGKVKGQYPVGKPSTPVFIEGGTITVPRLGTAAGVVCQVLGAQGEKRQITGAQDTGQNSGDVT